MIEERFFFPDFMQKYTAHGMNRLQSSGIITTRLASKTRELEQAKKMYKTCLKDTDDVYRKILPVGLLVALVCSCILKIK